ncbi:MAG TPA: zf-HC2 domain-containing protein, partial [Chloroflexota bacterium]|nr:zf-HC2 domain-containing protein [Chloroflexota bacterium]
MNIAPGHDSVADELNAYIDGELEAAERDRVSAHIRDCERCRADLADLSRIKLALTQLPQLRAPRPFTLVAPVGAGTEPDRFGA